MTEVDQRVVQMRFDDSDFDEKAKKTMKTLDKLSERLSFDAVAKKSDAALNEVVDNVEKMANKAYTIVDRVIDKIKDNIATKLVDYIKSATIDQVANGWQKYSEMTTAVGTLLSQGHKIEKVNKTLEDLSYFADETSYSFNDMLSGIAKFTAAGVKLDDAKVALMGISNWAAQSGQNAETASRVFGQLAQAMGTYMKKQDWMSVQTANMDTQEFRQTALDTAVALGTLKKAGENAYVSLRATTTKGAAPFTINSFVESLTQGAWMTSEVMVETYKKYATAVEKIKELYDATDGKIKTGSLIRERRQLNKEIIKQYSEIYKVTEETAQMELDKWSTLTKATDEEIENYAKLNKLSKAAADKKINAGYYNAVEEYSKRTRKSIKETEADLDQWSEYISEFSLKAFLNAQEARTFTDVINSVKESASSAWRTIYTSIFGDYDEAKVLWTDLAEGLIGLFTDRLYKISEIFEEWKNNGGRSQMLRGFYAFGYGISAAIEEIRFQWDELVKNGRSGAEVLESISRKIEEAGVKFYGFVQALVSNSFFSNLAQAFYNIKHFIDQIFGALYDGIRDAIPGGNFFLSLLVEFSEILRDFTANFKLSDAAVDGLRRTFKGLFIILNKSKKTIIELLVKVILPVLNVVFSVLGDIIECIATITGAIGDVIEYFMPLDSETSAFVTVLEFLAKVLTKVLLVASRIVVFITRAAMPAIGTLLGLVTSLLNGLANLFNGKGIKMGGGSETKLGKVFVDLKATIADSWSSLKSFKEITDEYKDGKGFMNFLRLFGDISEGIGQRLLLTIDSVLGFIEVMGNSKFGKVLSVALSALRTLVRGALWLFNNVLIPILKEVIVELGYTLESVKGIIEKDGILGLLDLIQEVFQTGIVAKLMETINLINVILGGNGLGKLFRKGADALDEIAGYFNAAKLNQLADIMLKVIGAIGLLYALLALITFLPEEKLDAMKERLLDFGLALGIVTGAMFLISASAHLAGANLIGLAASFFGLGFAISIAFGSLEKMAKFLLDFDESVVSAALEKLEHIMGELSLFILKTVLPFAGLSIFGGGIDGSIWGLGLVFAGIAAAIWMLVNATKGLESVSTESIDALAEFITKIWLVLSGSIALIVLAAQGNEVHAIGIAITALTTSLIALKVVFPLMREIAAQKGEFDGAIEAIGLFGAFMLAFSASLFFIQKGSNGLLASIGSMIMLKVFVDALRNKIFPMIFDVITQAYVLSGVMEELARDDMRKAVFVTFMTTLAILGALFIAGMAVLERTWGEVNPLTFLFIGATITLVTYFLSNILIPAVEGLLETVSNYSAGDILAAATLLFLMTLPLLAMSSMFKSVMKNIQKIYSNFQNFALMKVNVGIFTREFNFVSSVMQSIMLTVVGIYASIIAIMAIAGKVDWTPGKWFVIVTMFAGAFILIMGIYSIFDNIMRIVKILATIGNMTKKSKSIGGGAIYSNEDTLTTVIKRITGVMQWLILVMGLIVLAAGGIATLASETGKAGDVVSVLLTMSVVIAAVFAGMIFFIKSLSTTILATPVGLNTAKTINAISGIIGVIGAIFALIIGMTMYVSDLADNETKYNAFNDNLSKMLVIMGGILLSIGLLVKFIASTLSKNQMLSTYTGPATNDTYRNAAVQVLIVLAGITAMISAIGLFLLPAVGELSKMDISNVILIFIGVIAILMTSIAALAMSVGNLRNTAKQALKSISGSDLADILKILAGVVLPIIAIGNFLLPAISDLAAIQDANLFGIFAGVLLTLAGLIVAMKVALGPITAAVKLNPNAIVGLLRMLVGIVGPIWMIVYAMENISEAFMKMNEIKTTKLETMNSLLRMLLIFMGVGIGIGALAGKFPSITTGILAVAGAVAIMVAAFSLLAKTITGFTSDIEQGLNEGFASLNDTMEKNTEKLVNTAYKVTGTNSPSKEFVKLGKYMDQGLAKGVTSNMNPVKRAMVTLVDKGVTGVFERLLGIASPSKVFYKDGRFIVAGLVNGLNSQKSAVEDVSSAIGDAVKSGIEGLTIEAPDIWGGKDPEKWLSDALGNLDAGSIIGKMFGLDGYELTDEEKEIVKAYQDEIDKINKKINDEQGGHANEGDSREISRLQGAIDQIVARAKNKSVVEKAFDKIFDTDIIQKIGEKLGINLSSGATGESVLKDFKNNFIGGGINDENSILGGIIKDVKNSDWFNFATDIGGQIGGGIISGLKESGVAKTFMKLGKFFGVVTEDEYNQYLLEIGEKAEAVSNIQDGLFSGTASPDDVKKLKEARDAYNGTYRILSESYDTLNKMRARGNVNDILEAFGDTIDTAAYLGHSASEISGYIIQGFNEGWGDIIDEEGNIIGFSIDQMIAVLKSKLQIGSPSKLFKWMAEMCGLGAIIGTKESTPAITNAIEDQMSEEYKTMSLGMQAMDELASGASYTPTITPAIDTTGLNTQLGLIDSSLRVDPSKVNASLNVEGSLGSIANAQYAMASAIDKMRADILDFLSMGELVKVEATNNVNEFAFYDSMIKINREKYNRTGRNGFLMA